MTLAPSTVAGRLLAGLLALFAVSAVAVTLALSATRDVNEDLGHVAGLADEGRRLCEVGALVREYYMHQAHLALGMHEQEHLALSRQARADLGKALMSLDGEATRGASDRVRGPLAALDDLFDGRFLPALRAGRVAEAAHAHHMAADTVQQIVDALLREETGVSQAIGHARGRAEGRATYATAMSSAVLATALFLALGVALWMTRGITVPVARLRTAADGLPRAPAGTRVPESGPAEVAALGATLNRVLADLEEQRRARGEAETLAVLGRVAAGVAHEINNPLGAILGHARLIERAGGPAAEDAAVIAREAVTCRAIVQDLLDYARPGIAQRRLVDLGEVVEATVERGAPAGVVVRIAPDLPPTLGDARRLEQVVRNLIDNALAFGTRVEVDLVRDGDLLRLTVKDDGPGVPAADVERVFEPFFTTRADGVGLGLAIARSVAVAHGGSLRAAAGPGGCFELRLPVGHEPV